MERREHIRDHRPALVSFSGIDGAGKSTQVNNLCQFLGQAGLRVRLLSFWDDVAVFSRIRQWITLRLFKGEPGVGTPAKPVNRRDKNVQSACLNTARALLYLCDGLWARVRIAKLRKSDCDIVVLDRYLYDELANLPSTGRVVRAYSTLIGKLCPRPDVAFLLDADPQKARSRKPEYPVEFLKRNRSVYLQLSRLLQMVVIPEMPEPDVSSRTIEELVARTRSHIGLDRVRAAVSTSSGNRVQGCATP